MKLQEVTLEGERVRLIPLAAEHETELYEAGRYPQIWPYMPMKVETRADMQVFIADALRAKAGGHMTFAVYDRLLERFVGSTRLHDYDPGHRGLEIGWTWYTPGVWRTRVNTECKYLLLAHCFETLNLLRVQLKTDERNVRSREAIARLGAKYEGLHRKHRILSDGFVRNTVYFSIIDDDWPEVKARLEKMLH